MSAVTARNQPNYHRTLMRPLVVKGQTAPRSGFLTFFPPGWSRRNRPPVTCPGFIAVCWHRPHVSAPHTYLRLARHGNGTCRATAEPAKFEAEYSPEELACSCCCGLRLRAFSPQILG